MSNHLRSYPVLDRMLPKLANTHVMGSFTWEYNFVLKWNFIRVFYSVTYLILCHPCTDITEFGHLEHVA